MKPLQMERKKKKRERKKHSGNLNSDLRLYKLAQKKMGDISIGGTFLVH